MLSLHSLGSWRVMLLSCLLWVSVVFALPAPLERRAISQDVYNKLKIYKQWAAAAYCEDNNNSTGTKVTCEAGQCPDIQSADTKTLTEFENSIATDVTGFVALDNTNKLIVISFRGSSSIRNWLTDLNFPVTATDICADCSISTGFWTSWLESRQGVLTAVNTARQTNPSYKIIATGHSLGGAIASIAAGAIRKQGLNVDLYTYGQPKIGLEGVATYLSATNSTTGQNYRVTHLNDPVPRLPPTGLGYRHYSPEYYISSGDNVQPTVNDITRYDGINNQQGNEKDTGFDINAHTWYFGNTSGCPSSGSGIEFKKRDVQVMDLVVRSETV